jgi:hypothetical protein
MVIKWRGYKVQGRVPGLAVRSASSLASLSPVAAFGTPPCLALCIVPVFSLQFYVFSIFAGRK